MGEGGRRGRRGDVVGLELGAGEGGLEQGFSVRGRRQAKIDWHQRARAVLLLSPLLFYEFSIKRSSSAPAPRAARAPALLTSLPYCHLASVENFFFFFFFFFALLLLLYCFSGLQKSCALSQLLCSAGLCTEHKPGRSGFAAVFNSAIEIFQLSKCPCVTFPALNFRESCSFFFFFFQNHASVCQNSVNAFRLTACQSTDPSSVIDWGFPSFISLSNILSLPHSCLIYLQNRPGSG